MNEFWEIASPTTLASFIVDIQSMGTGATRRQLDLERKAHRMLIANVGESEANRLLLAVAPDAELGE